MKFKRTPLALAFAALPASVFATPPTELPPVQIVGEQPATAPLGASVLSDSALSEARARTSDTARLLTDFPGVSLYSAGGVSGLPVIHGLADERLATQVDGMNLIAACPNHMNSPLSYIDPTNVGSVRVYTGVVPVSVGGDSIGGAIVVDSADPVFAKPGEGTVTHGEIGGFYRSNGRGYGGNLAASLATQNFSLSYHGSTAQAEDYQAGGSFKPAGLSSTEPADINTGISHWLDGDTVGSTAYKAQNHQLSAAYQNDAGTQLFELSGGIQRIPYENYPNQRMDMTDNRSTQLNARYRGLYDWGKLEARLYRQHVNHEMNFGEDRQFWYGNAPGMPMNTESTTTGAKLAATWDLTARDALELGAEWQKYRLDDWWPPSGTGMMAPGTFWNINNGQRDRSALYAQWTRQWDQAWLTQFGLRGESVRMDADPVRGYSTAPGGMMNSYMATAKDAAAFNAADRSRTDHNLNASALARYTPDAGQTYEFGFARQVRSPSLYEVYPWSTWGMAAIMNNFVGDGNGYVGNMTLSPEKANTLSASADWHDATGKRWGVKLAPYYSYVEDYIDVRCAPGVTCKPNQFNVLQYVNQNARLYGADLSAHTVLAESAGLGRLSAKGQISYIHGRTTATGDALYNIVPWTGKVALVHERGAWQSTVETVFVGAKSDTTAVRGEPATGGYALVNLSTGYTWHGLRVDVGIDNLFNRFYNLPQGGVYVGQGKTMAINGVPFGVPVPGPGRSIYTRVSYRF
ncbi:TonB-dependent receptor [Halothiobacillus sp. DCM-1]|uniref:TonB-dependent receptor n=1 Tax=Halothiobacillus sp. DCM-1 TaxID=3112558 RepID=UPI00324DB4A3